MRVGEPNLLVLELLSVDGLSASSVLVGDVSSLSHEALDHSVENVVLVAEVSALLSCADCTEVLGSLGNLLGKQFEDDSTFFFFFAFVPDFDVEESLGVVLFEGRQFFVGLLELHGFFFVVNSLSKEFLHYLLLA